jgi:mannosylglycerate hydrolase
VRNLWLGRRTSRDLDVPLQRIGYLPDTFGHISQMPQILRGFGIANAFLWRGRGGDAETVKQEFRWRSPDGSEVLAHWFPNGYYQMPFLHFGNPDRPYEDKLGRIYTTIAELGSRATTDVLLLPYGGDHRLIDPNLRSKIEEANLHIAEAGTIVWATAEEYLDAIRAADPALEIESGELRATGPNRPYLLPGVLSTRLYLKRQNALGQQWLAGLAEPLSACAWLEGGAYDAELLWKAWELLVQNQPHDSICGCSIDQVHREMLPRFDQSRQIAEGLTQRAAGHIAASIDTSSLRPRDVALVAHNSLPAVRTEWASVWLPSELAVSPMTHVLLDACGSEVPYQTRAVEGVVPSTDRYFWTEVGFVAEDVPGAGHRTYRLTERDVPLDGKQVFFTAGRPVARGKGSEPVTDVRLGQYALENEFLRVEVDSVTGGLTVTDKRSGQVYPGLNVFEDGGDAGDSYNYSEPLSDFVRRSAREARVHVSVEEAGFARASLRVDLDWPLPASLTDDRLSRTSVDVPTRISSLITVTSRVPRVDVEVQWDNHTRDHRLRSLFPLGAPVGVSFSQADFSVEQRPVDVEDPGNGWDEPYVFQQPNSGWVSLNSGARGLTVANRGLPEYEVGPDGTILVTILRAVGWVSREDLLSRAGGAGPTTPAPEAQCPGQNRASYSIIPHAGDWLTSSAYREALSYATPLYGSHTDPHAGSRPMDAGNLTLEGDHTLVVSALKKAEDSDALLLRAWNAAGDATEARLRTARMPRAARRANLAEEMEEALLPLDDQGRIVITAGPAEIVTVMIEF